MIISRSVKERYWPNASALGKRIQVADVPAQVVGVVGDVHHTGLDLPAEQFMYLSMLDAEDVPNAPTAMTVTVRTAVEPLSLVSVIRRRDRGARCGRGHGERPADARRAR